MKRVDRDTSIENIQIKPYKKDASYSYTLGAFPTYELILSRPDEVIKVLVHSSYTDMVGLEALCKERNISLEVNDKLIGKLSDKDNCYVAGIFKKYSCQLSKERPHIVLVNPGNMGNLGTIIRTIVGFGIYDIAIILPGQTYSIQRLSGHLWVHCLSLIFTSLIPSMSTVDSMDGMIYLPLC